MRLVASMQVEPSGGAVAFLSLADHSVLSNASGSNAPHHLAATTALMGREKLAVAAQVHAVVGRATSITSMGVPASFKTLQSRP